VIDFLHCKLAGTGCDPVGYYAAPHQYFLFKTPGAGACLFAGTELSRVPDGGMFFVRIAYVIALPVDIFGISGSGKEWSFSKGSAPMLNGHSILKL